MAAGKNYAQYREELSRLTMQMNIDTMSTGSGAANTGMIYMHYNMSRYVCYMYIHRLEARCSYTCSRS